jgi:hypothetical protein
MRCLARFGAILFVFVGTVCCTSRGQVNSTIKIGQSQIDIVQEPGRLAVSHDEVLTWVRTAADAVNAYYLRYPVPHLALRIIPFEGRGVRGGKTFGAESGGRIRIQIGSETTATDLNSDWMMTHEMVHLTFPSVAEEHHWIEEGIATYVESIARVRVGNKQQSEMWYEVMRDLPQGLPKPGDEGLDNTHTWGRTYWGGALFCFLADLEIHRKTSNQKGLEDALRGILAAGGDIRQDWDLEKVLDVGDRATGVAVLAPLYKKMKDAPYNVNLSELWQQLGVVKEGKAVRFDDRAPLAATRVAMTFGATAAHSARNPADKTADSPAKPKN